MKSNKLGYVILLTVFILFNISVFIIPFDKGINFWITYGFTVIAFATQSVVWNVILNQTMNQKIRITEIPFFIISFVYLISQLVIFVLFLFIPNIDIWIVVLTCITILCIAIVFLLGNQIAKTEAERVEECVRKQVQSLKMLEIDVKSLIQSEQDTVIKELLLNLQEKIRFSDPISVDALLDLDQVISVKTAEIKNSKDKFQLITEIMTLLSERNEKCKHLK